MTRRLAALSLVLALLCHCLASDGAMGRRESGSILLLDHQHGLDNEYIDRQLLSDIADCYYNHEYIVSYSGAAMDIDVSQIEYVAINGEPVVQLVNFMSNHNINRINVLSGCLETLDQSSSLFVESTTDDAAPGGTTKHSVNIGIVLQYVIQDLFEFMQNQVNIAIEYANWRPSAMHLGWRCIQKVYMVNNNVDSSFRFQAEPPQGSIYTLVVPLANHVRTDVVSFYFRYGSATPRVSKHDLVDNSALLFSSGSEHTTGRLSDGSQSVLRMELWPYEDVLNIHDKRPEPFIGNSSRHLYEPKLPRLRRLSYMEQSYIEDKKERFMRAHANSSVTPSAFGPSGDSGVAALRTQLSRRQAARRQQLVLQQEALRAKSLALGAVLGLLVGCLLPWLLARSSPGPARAVLKPRPGRLQSRHVDNPHP